MFLAIFVGSESLSPSESFVPPEVKPLHVPPNPGISKLTTETYEPQCRQVANN